MRATFKKDDRPISIHIDAEWFQLTYTELRAAPDGNVVARYDTYSEAWIVPLYHTEWTDVVIHDEPAVYEETLETLNVYGEMKRGR